MKTNKRYLKSHFLKYPDLIPRYLEVTRVKGINDSKEANFLYSIVEDLKRNILKYPVDNVMSEEVSDKDDL